MTSERRVVLVTGAGSGLGLECALWLASKQWRVFGSVLTEAERQQLQAAARERGVEVSIVTMDVTDEALVRSTIDRIHAEAGLDDIVHFAGIGLRGFVEDLSLEEIRRVFDINTFGSMHVAKAALPHMREQRSGRILLTTSIAGRMASMSIGGYASSKFAVEGFAEALHQEAILFGVWVSLLEPGLIATPHFGPHRNRSRRAQEPGSPYYAWFMRHEAIVDRIWARKSFLTRDVARLVERVLKSRRPRLRYVVGRKAKIVFSLRRHLPGETFERLYWAVVRRIVTRREPDSESQPSPPDEPSRPRPQRS